MYATGMSYGVACEHCARMLRVKLEGHARLSPDTSWRATLRRGRLPGDSGRDGARPSRGRWRAGRQTWRATLRRGRLDLVNLHCWASQRWHEADATAARRCHLVAASGCVRILYAGVFLNLCRLAGRWLGRSRRLGFGPIVMAGLVFLAGCCAADGKTFPRSKVDNRFSAPTIRAQVRGCPTCGPTVVLPV